MDEISFTPRELDVMSILWRGGSGTVSEVREALEVAAGLGADAGNRLYPH